MDCAHDDVWLEHKQAHSRKPVGLSSQHKEVSTKSKQDWHELTSMKGHTSMQRNRKASLPASTALMNSPSTRQLTLLVDRDLIAIRRQLQNAAGHR
jgi:hypothetical protein